MGEGQVEVLDEGLHFFGGLGKHGLVALPDGEGHFALAHKGGYYCIGVVQVKSYVGEDFVKVGVAAAETGCSEQEYFFAVEGFQEGGGVFVAVSFIRPEAGEDQVRIQCFFIRCAVIDAFCIRYQTFF